MRVFKLLLTYIVVTIVAGVLTYGIWTIVNSFTENNNDAKVTGVIESATPVVAAESEEKATFFKKKYLITYVQNLKVGYDYEGKHYSEAKDFIVHTDYYNEPTSKAGKTYNSPYQAGRSVELYVSKRNPKIFDLVGDSAEKKVELKKVLYFAVPVYLLVQILFTASFIKKSKEIKKQKFMEKYLQNRY